MDLWLANAYKEGHNKSVPYYGNGGSEKYMTVIFINLVHVSNA